ncbi:Ionotropic receptor 146 [Blattella germanica]|nr:Ionotropic receptor 146 [Blattella germanica]
MHTRELKLWVSQPINDHYSSSMGPVLLLILIASVNAAVDLDIPALLTALQEHFHTSSVVVYYGNTTGLEDQRQLKNFAKISKVPVGVFRQQKSKNLSHKASNSLYVILSPLHFGINILSEMFQDCHVDITWLLYFSTESYQYLLADVYIPLDCEVIVFQPDYTLSEVYHLQNRLEILSVGTWHDTKGLVWTAKDFFQRRSDLKGITIKASTLNNPPITIVQEQNGTVMDVSGYFGDVWKVLEKEMNFTTEYYLPLDGSFGAKRENGTWSGMIAMILNGEVELAMSEFTITPIRKEVLDFTMPLIFTRFCVLIQQPSGIRSSWTSFLAPFSTNLWLTLLLVILLMSLHFAVSHQDFAINPGQKVIDALFQIFGIFCQQGQEETPQTLSGHILCMTTYLTAVILPAAYSAALTSFLTVQHTEMPFTTLPGLLEIHSYQLGVIANSGQLNYFDQAKEPLMKKLNDELIHPHRNELPASVSEGLLRLCKQPKYAFMASLDIAMALVNDFPCNVIPVTGASIPDTLAIAISKNSPYTQLINYNLEKMQKSGILARLRINAWPARISKSKPLWSEVGLETMQPVLCIVIVGILAAFWCLSIEYLINMRHTSIRYCFIKR